MQRDVETEDKIHDALRRVKFLESVFDAWDVGKCDVTQDDMGGFSFILGELREEITEILQRVEPLVAHYNQPT